MTHRFWDLVLSLLWHGFDPWLGNFHMSPAWKKKKKMRAAIQERKSAEVKSVSCVLGERSLRTLGGVSSVGF